MSLSKSFPAHIKVVEIQIIRNLASDLRCAHEQTDWELIQFHSQDW